MRKTILLTSFIILVISLTPLAIQKDIRIDSGISQVYVYPRSAMVIREGNVELDQGRYRVLFDDILEIFDEKTISVELGNASKGIARIMGVSIETVFLEEEPAEKIRQLQDEINQLEKEIKKISSEKGSLNDKKEFLNSIIYLFQDQKMTGNTANPIPSTEQLKSIYGFLDEKLDTNYNQALNYDFEIEMKREKINLLQKQLQQIIGQERETKKVVTVDLEVYQKNQYSILLSYQVNEGISWQPIYDVRANIKENRIELITYALINQFTGTDWKDIFLFLSTARPTVSGQIPPIESWFLRPYQPDQRISKTMEMPMVYQEESDIAATRIISEQDLLVPVEHRGTSLTFNIPQKVSLPSGSSQEKILISEKEMDGKFNYKTYPRVNPFMYFNVFIENNSDIPLLPGQVNIFLDGGFTGNTGISYIPPGKDFDISLGIAENIKVKRELLKKFRDETLIANIPSPKIVTKYEYKITVESFQEMKSLCHIFETIPVPEDDRIQINIDRVTKEPKVKDWNDKKGVWMWEFLLEPQEIIEINIIYSVVHPRDIQIIGLP